MLRRSSKHDHDDDDDEDDENDEESDDDEETPTREFGTPTTIQTHYTSSLNASISSIPTIASARSTPESIITIKTTKTVRKGSAHSNVSSAPSYVLNSNQYRMKKMAAKKEKERGQNHEDYENESELSFGPEQRSPSAATRMRDKGTTSVHSNGSYVTTRNWSR